MPPHVLPTHLFGGICRGHVTSRTHPHSRLPPLRVRAAQALPVKGVPKGEAPLVSLWLLSSDQESNNRAGPAANHVSNGERGESDCAAQLSLIKKLLLNPQ